MLLRSPQSILLSRLNKPNSLTLSSQKRSPCHLPHSCCSSGLTPSGLHPICVWSHRAGCSTPGRVSLERSRGQESRPLISGPGYNWPSGLWAHTNGSCWASHPSTPPNPSPQCFSQSFLHPACSCTWDCLDPGAFGHVALDEVHTGTPLKPLEVPLDSIPPSNVYTAPHSLCHWQTC